MKKIFLIIICLLLCGCYDYKEINELSFVSSIGIDYIDENYYITLEIIEENKEYIIVTSKGKTLAKAFDDISLKIAKIPYYYHIKVVVISKDVPLKDFTDYISRTIDIRNEFYLIVADNANKIITFKDDIGSFLVDMIEANIYSYNISYAKPFEDFLEKLLDPNLNCYTTYIGFDETDLSIKGLAIYKEYDYIVILDKEDSALINIINKEKNNLELENEDVVINIYESKIKYDFENNKVIISINSKAEIKENFSNLNFKNENTYIELSNTFTNIYKEKINNLIDTLKEYDLDVLSLKDKYYKKEKVKKDILNEFDINLNIKLEIIKKGLIFEVEHE